MPGWIGLSTGTSLGICEVSNSWGRPRLDSLIINVNHEVILHNPGTGKGGNNVVIYSTDFKLLHKNECDISHSSAEVRATALK